MPPLFSMMKISSTVFSRPSNNTHLLIEIQLSFPPQFFFFSLSLSFSLSGEERLQYFRPNYNFQLNSVCDHPFLYITNILSGLCVTILIYLRLVRRENIKVKNREFLFPPFRKRARAKGPGPGSLVSDSHREERERANSNLI